MTKKLKLITSQPKKETVIPEIKRAAVYVRVSTIEQAKEGYSIDAQKDRALNFCKSRGWLVADVIVDAGRTGKNLEREGIQYIIENLDKYDIVLVWKLDRLSRSQRDTLTLLEDYFLPNNVDFVSIEESFDTSTAFGRAMVGMLSVFAQLERETIRDRIMMGRKGRAQQGLYHGGSTTPIGYDMDDKGKLIINDYEAMQIRRIYEMFADGKTAYAIVEDLKKSGYTYMVGKQQNSWKHATTVLRVLANDVYIGTIRFADEVVINAHEPIIARSLWDKVQSRRRFNTKRNPAAFQRENLLTGFVICGKCGAKYYAHTQNHNKYYSCYSRNQPISIMAKAATCNNSNYRAELLEAIVDSQVRRIAFEPGYFRSIIEGEKEDVINSDIIILEDKIADIDKQIAKLMDLYQFDNMPAETVTTRISELSESKKALKQQINTIAPPPAIDEENIIDFEKLIHDISAIWEIADTEEKREILDKLIHTIVIDGDYVNIKWAFI